MSRKGKIVLAITSMITVMVSAFSYLYISQVMRVRIQAAYENASLLAATIQFAANDAIPDLSSTRVDVNNPRAVRNAIAEYLQFDTSLNNVLQSTVDNWMIVYDAAIVDTEGKAILHTNPARNNKVIPGRPTLLSLRDAPFRQQLRMVYTPAAVYDLSLPLTLDGAPFGSVRVGVSPVFLRTELTPKLHQSVYFSIVSILASLVVAAVVSHVALGPLKELSRDLDSVSTGKADLQPAENSATDEYGLVTLKVAHLGRQMRDANQIFSALKENVEQVMSKLQDGLMLFTRDGHVVLVSASAERFLGRPRREILGRTVKEIFSDGTALGGVILQAFQHRRPVVQYDVEVTRGRRVQINLDFIQERGTQIGALLTLRDTESVRRIEDEIEMSRRLSASGRLTRGVGHEVKNPINAIVLHLQLLQNKLRQVDPDTRRHIDIIDNEIHRLDRVVQILVDFTRPRDLRLEDVDLRRVLSDVCLLAEPDATQHGVTLKREMPDEPLTIKGDLDFMKQAVLNIVLNGIQSMTEGGTLTIQARRDETFVITQITDQGKGIPPEIQDRIFDLYFTTKKEGSGIGLAQTYQVLQWHYGSVDFSSVEGEGTTFRLRIPLAESPLDAVNEAIAKA